MLQQNRICVVFSRIRISIVLSNYKAFGKFNNWRLPRSFMYQRQKKEIIKKKNHLKTLWGKEENAGKPAFSPFSHNVFCQFKDKYLLSSHI